jgi:hypothetical protein
VSRQLRIWDGLDIENEMVAHAPSVDDTTAARPGATASDASFRATSRRAIENLARHAPILYRGEH